ncbi:RnfABCDGE type electron transport complex subunit B [Variovorax sp. J22G21]|uniref:RnfABCDGE type electron transport complex subunit B n=1 Tax=Variovorax fucosicus TaxID=3053517 RepID=UPI002578A33B|nr:MULTISPECIES: RnfABCDGE type electron transport complex subunit B [unclassified Variovorax]MDM0041908.1 RnfABCDGE type electron transport complex subunit B [Variovorax sp. J22R193]MDM0059678.1 RnfABCDGE type electron transport complex subunit B [Variovorax sp. J22G21]
MSPLAARIHAALPQTQCTRCGYPDCAGYAEAIANDEAGIHQCPPGGAEGIARLAAITGRPVQPLGTEFGTEGPRRMAVIDEAWCIGCTLCLDACPTDAILGIHKRMHTVIEPHCTGCELCIPVCPVDCISLEDATPGRSGWQAWSQAQADAALQRYQLHARHRDDGQREAQEAPAPAEPQAADTRKRSIVEAALARARAASQRPPATKP